MKTLLEPIEETREKYSEDDYRNMLDDIYGDVNICGINYNAGYALEQIDPIAFNVGFSDYQEEETIYLCPICNSEYEDEEEAKYCCQEEENEEEEEN